MPFRKIYSGVLVVGLSFFLSQLYSGGLLAEEVVSERDDGDIRMYEAASITVTAQKREEDVREVFWCVHGRRAAYSGGDRFGAHVRA